MNKELVVSFMLAMVVVGGALAAFSHYMRPLQQGPVATPTQGGRGMPQAATPAINPCPEGKMLQGECHVLVPGQSSLWIRKSDLGREKPAPTQTVNIASGGITESERRRLAEFENRQRMEIATRQLADSQAETQARDDRAQCDAIDREIRSIDAVTRQPLSASLQDYYRAQRKTLRDRQTSLRC